MGIHSFTDISVNNMSPWLGNKGDPTFLQIPRGGGGLLRGKKDRDDRRKSYILIEYQPIKFAHPKYTSWSKINLKIPISRSLLY